MIEFKLKESAPSTPAAPEAAKPKQSYLMTAANGMQVWVPEDKLEAWQAAQADQSDEARRQRELITAKILERMEQIRKESKSQGATSPTSDPVTISPQSRAIDSVNPPRNSNNKKYVFPLILLSSLLSVSIVVIFSFCSKLNNIEAQLSEERNAHEVYVSEVSSEIAKLETELSNSTKSLTEKSEKCSELSYKLNELSNECDFYREHILIASLDGTDLFHKYGCENLDYGLCTGCDANTVSEWGYLPCVHCYGTNTYFITDEQSKTYHNLTCYYIPDPSRCSFALVESQYNGYFDAYGYEKCPYCLGG